MGSAQSFQGPGPAGGAVRLPVLDTPAPEVLRVLLVEDNPGDAALTRDTLDPAHFQVQVAGTLEEGLQQLLAAPPPHVVLLDLNLPDSQGLDTLLAARKAQPWVPMIILTGLHDEGLGLEAIRCGAQDYAIKGPERTLLPRLLRYAVERTRSEQALRQSHALVQQLAENLREVLWVGPPDRRQLDFLSPSFEAIFGRTRESIAGRYGGWIDLVHPHDRPRVEAALRRHIKDRGVFHEEYRITGPQGRLHWVRDRAFPVLGDEGPVARTVGLIEDITARVAAEREIQFRSRLLDAVGQAIYATDLEGHVLYWNRGAEQLLGWSSSEVLGRHLAELAELPPTPGGAPVQPRVPTDVAAVASGEVLLRTREGQVLPTLVLRYPLQDDRGVAAGEVSILTDLRERHRAEAQRRAVEAQALELARLKELEAFRSHVLRVVSHELKTPLTPLLLQLDLLKQERLGPLTPRQRNSVNILQRNVEREARLVESVLDVARIQAGRLGLRRRTLDLRPLLGEAVEAYVGAAEARGQALGADVEDRPLAVEADADRLTQVLMNLLSNAVKFTPEGGRIDVLARVEGGEVVVRVRDTGIGFRQEQREQLFQPFARLANATAKDIEGSGLGLFISHGILAELGGRLWGESPGPGQGSTFGFALPLYAAPASPELPEDGDCLSRSDTPPGRPPGST